MKPPSAEDLAPSNPRPLVAVAAAAGSRRSIRYHRSDIRRLFNAFQRSNLTRALRYVARALLPILPIEDTDLVALGGILGELPGTYRMIFQLYFMEKQPFEEIARQINVPNVEVLHYMQDTLLYVRLRRDGMSPNRAGHVIHRPNVPQSS